MMKKSNRSVLLALAAGAACSVAANAQNESSVPQGTTVQKVRWTPQGLVPISQYETRAPRVYDAETGAACASYLATPHIIDDISFGPTGPWATTTNNVLRTISVPVANSTTTPVSFDLRIRIWDTANFNSNPMVAAGSTPLWQATLPLNNVGNGIYDLEITPTTPPTLPDSNVWVELECFQSGTTTLKPLGTASLPSLLWGVNRITTGPGSSTADWGRDRDNDDLLEGGAIATTEHLSSLFAGGNCNGQPINLAMFITGDVPTPPPANTALGQLADNQVRNDTIAAGQVKWYSFTLGGDIADDFLTYLDIDTLNSGVTDTALALYNSSGDVIWSDQDSGPDDQAQLTFGVGRRPANGNGLQFDGYDGELAAADTFYLAVAAGPATFDDAFTASSTGTQAGSFRLNFHSNANGSALPPSVAPVGTDLGNLVAPGQPSTPTLPGNKNLLWFQFNVCTNLDNSSPDNYLDIDFTRSDPSGDADLQSFLFDSSGMVVASSDDEGPNFFPQFSFGATNTRGPYNPGGQTFAGESGTLAAGTYYLAVGFFEVRPLATNDRWHVRPLGGDNLSIALDFFTGVPSCDGGGGCPPCAADFNQDGGVDGGDVESFFLTWQSGDTCGDTNQDGGVDGGDVEFFFLTWEAGGC